ncbi:hypothetical protein niasHT_000736 [Heterodera trifolii]|uniref:Uncharacterized protein n=1 Tax=Heterodera trifolii TaxID=157864 RepID=A0ABD2MEF6_9BILA
MRPNGILSQHFCIPIAGTQFSGIPITWTQTQQSFGILITGTSLLHPNRRDSILWHSNRRNSILRHSNYLDSNSAILRHSNHWDLSHQLNFYHLDSTPGIPITGRLNSPAFQSMRPNEFYLSTSASQSPGLNSLAFQSPELNSPAFQLLGLKLSNPSAFQSLGLVSPFLNFYHLDSTPGIPINETQFSGIQSLEFYLSTSASQSPGLNSLAFQSPELNSPAFQLLGLKLSNPSAFQSLGLHFCIPIAGTQFSGIPIAGTQFSGIPITWTQTQQSFGIPITGTCLTISKFLSPGLNPPASQSMRPNSLAYNNRNSISALLHPNRRDSILWHSNRRNSILRHSNYLDSNSAILRHSNHWDFITINETQFSGIQSLEFYLSTSASQSPGLNSLAFQSPELNSPAFQLLGLKLSNPSAFQSLGLVSPTKFLSPGLNPPASQSLRPNSLALQSMRPNEFYLSTSASQSPGLNSLAFQSPELNSPAFQLLGLKLSNPSAFQSLGLVSPTKFLSPGLNPPASQSMRPNSLAYNHWNSISALLHPNRRDSILWHSNRRNSILRHSNYLDSNSAILRHSNHWDFTSASQSPGLNSLAFQSPELNSPAFQLLGLKLSNPSAFQSLGLVSPTKFLSPGLNPPASQSLGHLIH